MKGNKLPKLKYPYYLYLISMDSQKQTPFKKPRNDIPSYEDMLIGVRYAITINPCDKMQKFRDPLRLTSFLNEISKLLYHNNKIYRYTLYPELSPKGRLHYHGYITILDIDTFYLYSIPNLLKMSTIVIKPIKEESKEMWQNYCIKQSDFHSYILEHYMTITPLVNY
ncbi:MAG: putative replicase-associated protein [Cressdnaviricota sp.]|nr:MAG: putative replicase-associated protein [Cressdnaviricota sp.]